MELSWNKVFLIGIILFFVGGGIALLGESQKPDEEGKFTQGLANDSSSGISIEQNHTTYISSSPRIFQVQNRTTPPLVVFWSEYDNSLEEYWKDPFHVELDMKQCRQVDCKYSLGEEYMFCVVCNEEEVTNIEEDEEWEVVVCGGPEPAPSGMCPVEDEEPFVIGPAGNQPDDWVVWIGDEEDEPNYTQSGEGVSHG